MNTLRHAVIALIAAGLTALVVVFVQHANEPAHDHTTTPTTQATVTEPATTEAPSTTPTTAVTGLKPLLRGMVAQAKDTDPDVNVLHSFVVSADWAELQPERGGAIVRPNVIDAALDALGANSGQVRVKLRVFAGVDAPDWAKNLDGAPFTVQDPSSGRSGTVGRFWTRAFGNAYDDLETKLAAIYDRNPAIAEVEIARCTTIFAEPFLRELSVAGQADTYVAAGYTQAADRACVRDQIASHRVWQHTRAGLALNPYQYVDAAGKPAVDEPFTEDTMRYCRDILGDRCVLENNSIRSPPTGGHYTEMYAAMKQLGGPIAFQTAAASRIGDARQTVEWAIQFGASAVEMGTRANAYTRDELIDLDARLRAVK